ncbi:MAG: HAD family phosphatase [Erysipelotrichaceae bacterium]|nr:HAD family phosphatase [Erysipelotrichaceae bacterium]
MGKYVFIDVDGTLFDHSTHSVPVSAVQALRQAKENGHKLFVCTGRVKEYMDSSYFKLPVTGFVYACGAHVEMDGQEIYSVQFPRKEIDELSQFMEDHQIEYSLEGKTVNFFTEPFLKAYESYFCKGLDEKDEMSIKFKEKKVVKTIDKIQEEDYSQILKMAFQTEQRELMLEYLKTLPSSLEYFVYSDSISGDLEGEILVKGADKASGIDHVLEYFGGNLEDTIALGDSDNDLSMIEHAHIGVAMGNACDSLKEKADYITAHVSDDGLYKAFKYLGLIE